MKTIEEIVEEVSNGYWINNLRYYEDKEVQAICKTYAREVIESFISLNNHKNDLGDDFINNDVEVQKFLDNLQ